MKPAEIRKNISQEKKLLQSYPARHLINASRRKDLLWHAKSVSLKPPSSREQIIDLRATVSILQPPQKTLILPFTHLEGYRTRDR